MNGMLLYVVVVVVLLRRVEFSTFTREKVLHPCLCTPGQSHVLLDESELSRPRNQSERLFSSDKRRFITTEM